MSVPPLRPREPGSGPPDLVSQLLGVLQAGATPVPPWHLGHPARWHWLVDTLMGHPLVRGGQRPRDFPADPAGRRAVEVAVALQALPLQSWNLHRVPKDAHWRLGSWLYAFVLLMEGGVVRRDPGHADQHFHEGILWVILQILRGMGKGADDSACQALLAALGMGLWDAGPLMEPALSRWGSTCHLGQQQDNLVAAAAEGAALVACLEDAQTRGAQHEPWLVAKNPLTRALLDQTGVWLVTLKTCRVQAYIERAQDVWVTRGASVWAAQALAFAREELLGGFREHERTGIPTLRLLADVDALTRFTCFEAPDCGVLKTHLRKRVRKLWSAVGLANGALGRRYPRLTEFLKALPERDRAAATTALSNCLPEFSIEVSGPFRLTDLCLRRPPQSEEEVKIARTRVRSRSRLILKFPSVRAVGPPCAFVAQDRALAHKNAVPWMHPEQLPRMIGLTGLVWSLAGATFRMHTSQGLAEMLGLTGTALRSGTFEWLGEFGDAGREVAYLKLDGDHVGETLRRLPMLRALGAGLELHLRTFAGLRSGIRSAQRWLEEQEPDPGCARRTSLPVEVIYQGGDDLLCMVPKALLDPFLRGFAAPGRILAAPTFTGVAITLPGALTRQGSPVPFLVAQLVPLALEWAKNRSRGLPVRGLEQKLRCMAHGQGYILHLPAQPKAFGRQVTIWPMAFEPCP